MKKYPVDVFLAMVLTIAFLMAIWSIQTGNELANRLLSMINNMLGLYIALDKLFPSDDSK